MLALGGTDVIGVPYYVISRSYLRGVLIVCQKRGIWGWGGAPYMSNKK